MLKPRLKAIENPDEVQENIVPNGKPQVITDFGTRAVYRANFSRAVSLPKLALSNCGIQDTGLIQIQLVQEADLKYLRLVPIQKKGGEIQ